METSSDNPVRPLQPDGPMHEKRPCPQCSRAIDAGARVCPFCNYDPTLGPAPATVRIAPAAKTTVAPENPWLRFTLSVGGIVLGLVAVFFIGWFLLDLNENDEEREAETTVTETTAVTTARPQSGFPQVTLGAADPTAGVQRSVTTTPVAQPNVEIPAEFQREDATALPSTEYAAILARSQRQETSQPARSNAPVDPRSLTAPSPVQPAPATTTTPAPRSESPRETSPDVTPDEPPAETTRPPAREPARTEYAGDTGPVPVRQPIPRFSASEIREPGTVRLRLTIDSSGNVREVDLLQSVPGVTAKLVSAVQRWKFRPATRNGQPVEGTFVTDIYLKADGN